MSLCSFTDKYKTLTLNTVLAHPHTVYMQPRERKNPTRSLFNNAVHPQSQCVRHLYTKIPACRYIKGLTKCDLWKTFPKLNCICIFKLSIPSPKVTLYSQTDSKNSPAGNQTQTKSSQPEKTLIESKHQHELKLYTTSS